MKHSLLRGLILFGAFCTLPINSFAMMPVIDVGAITQLVSELDQLEQQYSLLEKTYKNAGAQLEQAKEIAGDAEGHYGFGNLFNSAEDLNNREWSPDNWKDTLNGLSGGNPARYHQLLQAYQNAHPALSQSEFEKGESAENAKRYESEVKTNQAVSVNTTYAFNDIKTHLTSIHTLSEQIEKAQNTKAAVDLNSRLLAEMAYIQVQELKMQTVLNEHEAAASDSSLSSQSDAAKFNRLPTN